MLGAVMPTVEAPVLRHGDDAGAFSRAEQHGTLSLRVIGHWIIRNTGDDARKPSFSLQRVGATNSLRWRRVVVTFGGDAMIGSSARDAVAQALRAHKAARVIVRRGYGDVAKAIQELYLAGRKAEAMEVIVMAEPDSAARTSQLVSLANLYAQMEGRQLDALRVRRELLIAQPDDGLLRAEVERSARELGRMDLVASAYEQMLKTLQQRADESEARGEAVSREAIAQLRDLQLARGTILRDDLRQGEEAESAFAAVLDREETHQAAYEALEELLKMRGANEALMKLYRRRVDVIFDPEEQKRLLSRITYIARDVLGLAFSATLNAPVEDRGFGVFRM